MSNGAKPLSGVRRNRSIYQVHYCLQKEEEVAPHPYVMPTDMDVQAYGMQVAGHDKSEGIKYLGLLQCPDGKLLKPIIKESQKREVEFYEKIKVASLPDLLELRSLTPKYYGCKQFEYNGYVQDYIILEDCAMRMLEPCIMDVKIGKRTWDPLASEEKMKNEQKKYALCKQEYGFCIPGYQVYTFSTGKLHKFNKDHGKKLHGQMVINALRNYLNGVDTYLCRALILQFLSQLWQIQRWWSKQNVLKLYSSSLLLVYDANTLTHCCVDYKHPQIRGKCRPTPPVRRKSIHSISPTSGSNFSNQINSEGPVYKKVNSVPISPISLTQTTFATPTASSYTQPIEKLNHNHSFEHNFEEKLCKIKMNYRAVLDQLSSDNPNPNPWGTVKIIDFAHAFFNEEEDLGIDNNCKEGIDNFVKIFESFLRETDDQVF